MILVTPLQMREIDEYAIKKIGIPGSVLMENAALAVVDQLAGDFETLKGKNICLFAGKGNNGGDAFAIARHLYNRGANVTNFLFSEKKAIAGDARINMDILDKMDINIIEIQSKDSFDQIDRVLSNTDIVVDGIFGTGFKGRIDGLFEAVIKLINEKMLHVISVDIPSGVDSETGEVDGVCINAYKTVTFGFAKPGHFLHPGCDYTGKLVISDISIPKAVLKSFEIGYFVIDEEHVKELIPKRYSESNKGDYGKVLFVTGSVGMTGAGCLAGNAALRSGTGIVYLAVPFSLASIYETNLIEAVTIPLEDIDGYISKNSVPKILKNIGITDVVAMGPGLSTMGDVREVVYSIIKNSIIPMVIDADAINVISKDVSVLRIRKAPIVLTPHPGEMARLMGTSIQEIQQNRIKSAREFSKNFDVITVLKGSRTIVAAPDGSVYINITGNPGMATGGTGDVLTGIIASFIGQGVEPLNAAIAGVYIHGLCGDNVAQSSGEHGLTAGDMVRELKHTINKYVKECNVHQQIL